MDNELKDLCEEVYKRTKWETQARYYVTIKDKSSIWHWEDAQWLDKTERFPLYTSDYLLEKLPPELSDRDIRMDWGYVKGESVYRFAYINGHSDITDQNDVEAFGDTPLKALLKLVIVLDDAGVKL